MGGRWQVPATGLILGVLSFGAAAIGGQPATGAAMFAVMAIYTMVVVIFRGRSETIDILGGQAGDERQAALNLQATAVAGFAAICVAIGGFIVDLARGGTGIDFAIVAAAGGIGYLATLAWFRARG